jgi:hypothetical protein
MFLWAHASVDEHAEPPDSDLIEIERERAHLGSGTGTTYYVRAYLAGTL